MYCRHVSCAGEADVAELLSDWISFFDSADARRGLLMWSAVCLIFYFYHRYRLLHVERKAKRLSSQLEDADLHIHELQQEFRATFDENQLMRSFLTQSSVAKATRTVLKGYLPNPKRGFAVLLQILGDEQRVAHSRGLSDEIVESFHLPEFFINSLVDTPYVQLDEAQLQRNAVLASLPRIVRSRISQLTVAAAIVDGTVSSVFLTTELLPRNGTEDQQRELAVRVIRYLNQRLTAERDLVIQQNQLRLTSDMLQLRSVAERTSESPSSLVREYLTQLMHLLHADRLVVFLGEGNGSHAYNTIRCGKDLSAGIEPRWFEHESLLADLYRNSDELVSLTVADLHKIGICSLIGSAAVVPLLRDGRQIGNLCCTRRRMEPFAGPEKDLATWAAEDLANVMHRLTVQFNIAQQARTDALTNLANRREFDDRLSREWDIARRANRPLSLLMLDLDRFKFVNDEHGHQAGDLVLQQTAERLRKGMRRFARGDDDFLLARYGGEELAIVLPRIPVRRAREVAESLRLAVEFEAFQHGETVIRATLSVGVADLTDEMQRVEDLVAAADLALYQAKQRGRNRVVSHSPGELLKQR